MNLISINTQMWVSTQLEYTNEVKLKQGGHRAIVKYMHINAHMYIRKDVNKKESNQVNPLVYLVHICYNWVSI